MARIDSPRRTPRERDVEHDEFYETMTPPLARTYRTEQVVAVVGDSSTAERAVRLVASILSALLAIRFIVGLFTTDMTNGLIAVIFNATGWMTAPFQSMFGSPPSGGGGYFDLPAIAAVIVVALIAWAINSIIRSSRRDAV